MRRVEAVLYLVSPETETRARVEMEKGGGLPRRGPRGKDWMVVPAHSRSYQFRIVRDISEALSLLSGHYFNFVVLDGRSPSVNSHKTSSGSIAMQFMDQVHYSADPERMYPLARIISVLDSGSCLAKEAFQFGKRRIGGFVVDPFEGSLMKMMYEIGSNVVPGKSAICLSGGGVEGFLFEIGVLKALNAHLQSRSVTDFDIFCGISAGSILTAFLANQTEPEEIAAAVCGSDELPGVDPVTPKIIFDPHFKEYLSRIWDLGRRVPLMSWERLVSAMLKTIPTGFFRGEALKKYLEKQLTSNGRSNDFRELDRELYIGATDQDTSVHTIFGAGQWQDIPISTAVRASTALTPFFEPEKIRGKYFVDGQYTRTSNYHFAIERGAKLIVVVDPLVPLKTDKPGYVRAKGGVFAAIQALKAVINTRFMHGIRHAAENNPDVDFVLFAPDSDDMRLMSGSPMKYNIRTEIVNLAYRCTVRKIQRDFEILNGTFAKHGFRIQRHPRLRTVHHEVY